MLMLGNTAPVSFMTTLSPTAPLGGPICMLARPRGAVGSAAGGSLAPPIPMQWRQVVMVLVFAVTALRV